MVLAKDREVGAEVRPTRSTPIRAASRQPAEIGADGRRIGPLRVGGGVARSEGAQEPRKDGVGRRAGWLPAHASGAGSTGRKRFTTRVLGRASDA